MPNTPDRTKFFITPEELAARQDTSKILDGSWHMPGSTRNALADYTAAHIRGAHFFDIDALSDQSSDLPHMLPAARDFAAAMGAMGIGADDEIVIYDTIGLFSGPRVWWTFHVMGATNVRLLEGGLPAWIEAGYPLTDEIPSCVPRIFTLGEQPEKVTHFQQMQKISASGAATILDARPSARFTGNAPEPRPGLSSGHMPNATSLPFTDLLDGKVMKQTDELQEIFQAKGVRPDHPVVTSCGSGITAAILTLGLALAGYEKASLYDGSWSQWAAEPDAPILQGDD